MERKKRSFTLATKLEAIKYAEEKSGAAAARYFRVDPKRIRIWRQQKDEIVHQGLGPIGKKKKNLEGQGGRAVSNDMENELFEWILENRNQGYRISRKMIAQTAKNLYPLVNDKTATTFKASRGWLDRFLKRYGLSLRRKTTEAQKDPAELSEKLVSFVAFASHVRKKYNISDRNILAMDETSVWFDWGATTTVDQIGRKSIPIKTTGHSKAHASVILAARADGTKLPPYIVFRKNIRKVNAMQNTPGAVVSTSVNGWLNTDLTKDWLDKVVGKTALSKRLLAWDSYRCHICPEVKAYLKQFNIETAVIPGGCTKYIQAPDVSWNKPFKLKMNELYDTWIANNQNKEYTSGGNLKAVSLEILTEWVKEAWDSIHVDLILKSFRCCALSIDPDGSEDTEITCFKDGQPCRAGWEMLVNYRDSEVRSTTERIRMCDEEDEEQLEMNEMVIEESDDDEDTDFRNITNDIDFD